MLDGLLDLVYTVPTDGVREGLTVIWRNTLTWRNLVIDTLARDAGRLRRHTSPIKWRNIT